MLAGRLVHLHVNSSAALAVLHKGSTIAHLHELAMAVWRRAVALHARLVELSCVASADNPADAPSRATAARLGRLWGPLTVDAFATPATVLLPRHWTR